MSLISISTPTVNVLLWNYFLSKIFNAGAKVIQSLTSDVSLSTELIHCYPGEEKSPTEPDHHQTIPR